MCRQQYLALFVLAILLTACGTEPKKAAILNTLPTPFPTAELLIAPPDRATSTPWLSPLSATTMAYYGPKLTEVAGMPKSENSFRIDGTNFGEYGKNVITNAGTENQLSYVGYFFPAGNYRATNNDSRYLRYILVYSVATIWENGIEYPADTYSYRADPGQSVDVYIRDGYYVKLIPPADITMRPLGYTYSASTPEPKAPSAIHMPTNIYSPTPKPTDKPCYVKGNPNSMIYHCPGSPNYDDLNDYACFSSSAEAQAAGYRPAKNMSWCAY